MQYFPEKAYAARNSMINVGSCRYTRGEQESDVDRLDRFIMYDRMHYIFMLFAELVFKENRAKFMLSRKLVEMISFGGISKFSGTLTEP